MGGFPLNVFGIILTGSSGHQTVITFVLCVISVVI